MAGNIFRDLRKGLGRHFGPCGRRKRTLTIAKILRSILVVIGVLVFFNAAPVQAGDPLPEGEGRSLVSKKCQKCHDLGPIKKMRGSRAQWSEVLEEMTDNGLFLNEKEREIILRYLATHLGFPPEK